jgi:thiamine-monophosphate kinase
MGRALSDIAAMGAEPRFCMVSLAVSQRFDIEAFHRGVRTFQVPVAGGDLARVTRFACDVVVCGAVPRGSALRRDGALPGETVYVSGPLGGNAASGSRRPAVPRLALGRRLRARASACIDISDDLYRLCMAPGVGAFLHSVPTAERATESQALQGGEDYELLYTGRDLPGLVIGTINDRPAGCMSYGGYPLAPHGWGSLPKRIQ